MTKKFVRVPPLTPYACLKFVLPCCVQDMLFVLNCDVCCSFPLAELQGGQGHRGACPIGSHLVFEKSAHLHVRFS
jgi:hypothetical protein